MEIPARSDILWSPDMQKLVAREPATAKTRSVVLYEIHTGIIAEFDELRERGRTIWAPDSSALLVQDQIIFNLRTRMEFRLLRRSFAAWSPNGARFATTLWVAGVRDGLLRSQVAIHAADGTLLNAVGVVKSCGPEVHWSPNGDWLALGRPGGCD